jgi:hypothetical protein
MSRSWPAQRFALELLASLSLQNAVAVTKVAARCSFIGPESADRGLFFVAKRQRRFTA